MRIRAKLLSVVLVVVVGFLADAALSVRTYARIAAVRGTIDEGVRLIAQARKVRGLMTDVVFDLFSPSLYSSLQGVILSPSALSTQKEWKQAIDEFHGANGRFIKDPNLVGLLNDEELKSTYELAGRMSDRAFSELDGLESDFALLRERYAGAEELYSRLQLSGNESLYGIFSHMRSSSYYLGNVFEGYLDRFVSLLEASAAQAEERTLVFYAILSAALTAFAVAGVLFTTRSMLANARLVEEAVERISRGDFSSPVAPSGHDELGQLAERVNLFAQRLKGNVDYLASILGDVNSAVPEAPDLDRIISIVAKALLREEGAEGASVCLVEGGRVSRSAWAGFPPVLDWLALGLNLIEVPEPIAIRDISQARLSGQSDRLPESAAGFDPGIRSALVVPLVARRRFLGLCAFAHRSRPFTDLEISQLESFADYAAQVIDNALAYAALRARGDAEFQALQSQVQPHFIYNVLNGFMALNRMGERSALEASLHALRDMMRYSLEHSRIATVSEEFAFLEQYCRLQKLRFEERFSYEFRLDERAASLPIPKLLVQPLLENALIHGIEPSTRPCRATVSARVDSGKLLLEVEDDGMGCDPSAIAEKGRVGIANIRERLSLLYGSASLELSGRTGGGFRALISLPLAELEGGVGEEESYQ